MEIYKRICTLLICIALLICIFPVNVSAESDFPTVLAEAKKGVIQVYGRGENRRGWSSWTGTGFAVGEASVDSDVFLTNWHVVTQSGDYDLDEVRIWILQENCTIDEDTGEPNPNKSITCEVLKTTTGNPDYAIIRATEPVQGYKAMPLLSSEGILDGTKVYALGYPAVVGDFSASRYGTDDITATDGIVSQHMQLIPADNTWVLMHTAQISGGNSGGPLITQDGAVVGLNTYEFGETRDNMNRYCAVYIDYAIDGLDELSLPYELFADQSDETVPEETEEAEAEQTPAEESDEEKDEDEGDGRNLVPWLIAGGVILVAAAMLIVILKKKKAQEAERRRQEAERNMEAERRRQEEYKKQEQRRREQEVKARLQWNGGSIYPVPAIGCAIGRERDCGIVLPENTPGVSRHHCKLEFRNGQLILTDLNSTYGTFICNKRIPANTPVILSPGASFCLGSEKCKFTVC